VVIADMDTKILLALFLFVGVTLAMPIRGSPTFNKQTSYRFVYYAYAAYNVPAVNTWNCPYCVNYTTGFVHTTNCNNVSAGSFAYVGYHPTYQEIVASFRGSSNIPNWIEDLYAIQTPPGQAFPGVPQAQVEDGFWYYYQSLKSCVLAEIKNLRTAHPTYKIAITGHSLGAAGAALCAMDLTVNYGYSGIEIYNFGEPRVGNKPYYSAALTALPGFQRMVDYEDCVPKLPPEAFGYWHEAYEIYEHPTGADVYEVCNSSGEDPSCSDSVGQNCDDHMHYMGVQCCDAP
jgi:hypothetical protein